MGRKSLEIEKVVLEKPHVTIFRLRGELTGTADSYEFLESFRDQARQSSGMLVLNLAGVEQVNSSGVGILAACYTSVTNAGGRACLAAPSRRLKTILDVVKLSTCFCVTETEEEAIGLAS